MDMVQENCAAESIEFQKEISYDNCTAELIYIYIIRKLHNGQEAGKYETSQENYAANSKKSD
jgi:hypothetical protein